jgi:hypothetical protein
VTYLRNVLESCEDRTGGREDAPNACRTQRAYQNACLDVCFINTLPVAAAPWWVRHAREGGHPEGERHGDWMPAFAGMTFSFVMALVPDLRNRHLDVHFTSAQDEQQARS